MAYKIKRERPRELAKPIVATKSSYQRRAMYETIRIKGFRGFEDLSIDDLSSVNLFCGRNNCGKTSILEAVYSHSSGLNFTPFHGQVVIRRTNSAVSGGLDFGEKILSLFKEKASFPYSFTISGKVQKDPLLHSLTCRFFPSPSLADLDPRSLGQYSSIAPSRSLSEEEPELTDANQRDSKRSLRIPSIFIGKWQSDLTGERVREVAIDYPLIKTSTVDPFRLAVWSDVLSHRDPENDVRVFSYLKRYNLIDQFTSDMRTVFPEIMRIDAIPYPDATPGPVTIFTADDRQVPLYAFGDGMRRWFYLLGHMAVYKNACHCIEEIDSTFHSTAHAELSQRLIEYSEHYSNQLFITSHSIEFIDNFLTALYGENGTLCNSYHDPVRIFTIRKSDSGDKHEVWALKGKDAYQQRRQFQLELR